MTAYMKKQTSNMIVLLLGLLIVISEGSFFFADLNYKNLMDKQQFSNFSQV
jgi:hypothetical protein